MSQLEEVELSGRSARRRACAGGTRGRIAAVRPAVACALRAAECGLALGPPAHALATAEEALSTSQSYRAHSACTHQRPRTVQMAANLAAEHFPRLADAEPPHLAKFNVRHRREFVRIDGNIDNHRATRGQRLTDGLA